MARSCTIEVWMMEMEAVEEEEGEEKEEVSQIQKRTIPVGEPNRTTRIVRMWDISRLRGERELVAGVARP